MQKNTKLGWIGLGVMGEPMCHHLLAAGCWSLDNLAPRMNRQDFSPGFMVDHFIKDLGHL